MPKFIVLISFILIALGIICMVPSSCLNSDSPSVAEDAFIPIQPMIRIPLESLKSKGSTSFSFKVNSVGIAKTWGEQYFVIYSRHQNNGWWMNAFSSLQLQIQVLVGGSSVAIEKAPYPPYMHSSNTLDIGLRFSAKPGDEVRINVQAPYPTALPEGELVVAPNWDTAIKDHLVGAMIEDDLNHWLIIAGRIGLALSFLGLIGLFFCLYRGATKSRKTLI
jgi:hypothetical protein